MKIKTVNLIVYLIYFYLPIDTLNGILIRNFELSISPVYKIFTLVLMLVYITRQKNYSPLKWTIFFILIFIFHLIIGIHTSLAFSWGLKFLAIIISFSFFKILLQEGRFDIVKNLAFISFALIGINIFIGLIGFGYAQYARDDVGTRGLFYAGNELGVLLLVTSLIILSKFLVEQEMRKYLFFSFLFIVFAAMLTTKTAVLGQILVVFVLPVIELVHSKRGFILKKRSIKIAGFGFLVMFAGLPAVAYVVLYELNLIERISYWAGKVDMVTLFFSGRNLLAAEVYEYVKLEGSFYNNLIGYGYDTLISAVGRSVEIDFIDLFMLFGFIGVLAMYGFFINQLFSRSNLSDANFVYKPYVRFGILLLLFLSCMSGHVLNSGLAGIMIGALLSLQFYSPSESDEEN